MKIHAPHRVQVLSHKDSVKGGWLEHLKDEDPHYVQQSFLPSQRQGHREIVDAFGSATPHSSSVLLQYAGDPEQKTQSTPVLLVHGSKVDGEFFHHSGLIQAMKRQGMQVFTCTFAHNHDNNFVQAQQVGNALARIRELTGARQVDVVGHSKGCIAATVYATPEFREDWMSDYQGDVRKLLLVGGPNGATRPGIRPHAPDSPGTLGHFTDGPHQTLCSRRPPPQRRKLTGCVGQPPG